MKVFKQQTVYLYSDCLYRNVCHWNGKYSAGLQLVTDEEEKDYELDKAKCCHNRRS